MAHVALSCILGSQSTYTMGAYYIDSLGTARGYGKGPCGSRTLDEKSRLKVKK